ncbi:MAG: hypothetical protein AB7F40_10010 [Victivallaceae bacterium]|nr:hypothetical protein [Victivallaceae bacterium]
MKKMFVLMLAVMGMALASASDAGGYSVDFKPSRGLTLLHGLWNVAVTSRVIAVDGKWNHYFYDRDASGRCVESSDGASLVYSFEFDGDYKFNPERYRVTTEGDVAVIELSGALKPDCEPGTLEYTTMIMPDDYFGGAAFVAVLADGSLAEGVIGEPQKNGTVFARGFRKIVFVSADGLAKLTISVESGLPLSLTECRNNPWFEGRYGLRLGVDIPLEPGKRVEETIKVEAELVTNPDIKLPPVPAETAHRNVGQIYEQKVDCSPIPYRIRPKSSELAPVHPDFSHGFTLTVSGDGFSGEDASRLGLAADRINHDELGVSPAPGAPEVAVACVPADAGLPQPDGFALQYTPDGLNIASPTARGAFYGLQEFRRQLSCGDFRNVRDYPDLEYRGVFIFSADGSLEFNRELIDRVLVPCRINNLVIESSRVHWDTFPALRNPKGMSKSELEELVDYANRNFIDCTPCIATLGHMEWLFDGGANLEFAEDPETPYSYFTGHPGLYPLMDRFMSEVYETFNHPEYLHISHDEWTLEGRYPFREATKARKLADIFYDDVMFYHDFAVRHGAKVMLWQDMLCTRDESKWIGAGGPPHNIAALRPKLPRDLVFAVWRYDRDETYYKDVHVLAAEGFPVIGCGWDRPTNIENLARDCKLAGALGYLQTTWAGYFPDATILDREFNQVAAYARAGVSSWNTGQTLDDPCEALRIAWNRLRPVPSASGISIDLPEATAFGESLLPFGSEWRCGFVDGVWFDRMGGNTVSVRSRYQPDSAREVTIPVNARAGKLHFLHTTRIFDPDPYGKQGSYMLNYADGTHCEFELGDRVQVQAIEGAVTLRRGVKIASGSDAVLRGYCFVNPHPDKEIKSITLRGGWRMLPLELAALTLEN